MISNLIKSINKNEWWFLAILTVILVALTTLPYLYGSWQTPADHVYAGLHSITPGDMHVYFSYMEQVKQGHLLFEDLYTSEPQSRVMLNIFWLVEGLIAKITGLSNNLIFQLTRILLIPLFTFILYVIACFFWAEKKWRKICFIFFCFASGLGATISIFPLNAVYQQGWYNWPLDLWAAENNNLLIMFQSPHFIASTVLLLIILFLAYLSFEKNYIKYSLLSGLFGLLLFQFHPFHAPTIFAVLIIYLIILFIKEKKINFNYLKHFAIIGVLSSPSIIYWLLLGKNDFVAQIRTFQNICLTPALWVTCLSYGFLLVLSVFTVYKIIKIKQFTNQNIFLTTWLIVQFALLFSPLPFQRRLQQGLSVPMVILTVMGLRVIYDRLKQKLAPPKFNFYVNNGYLLIFLFVILFTTSQIYNWVREIAVFEEIHRDFYFHTDKAQAYHWLKNMTSEGSIVLADFHNGNFIPGRAGRKVYVGHGVETLFFDSKLYDAVWFFKTNHLDEKKLNFLISNNIDYIFFSQDEKDLGDFAPAEKKYLVKVYKQGQVELYQVLK